MDCKDQTVKARCLRMRTELKILSDELEKDHHYIDVPSDTIIRRWKSVSYICTHLPILIEILSLDKLHFQPCFPSVRRFVDQLGILRNHEELVSTVDGKTELYASIETCIRALDNIESL